MAPLKVSLDIKKRSVKEKRQNNSSLLSYTMRGEYNFRHLAYGVHHRGVQLVELLGAPSAEYVGKDRPYGTGFSNLWPGRPRQFMEPQAIQRYSHTLGTKKTIRQTKFFFICFFLQVISATGSDSTGVG